MTHRHGGVLGAALVAALVACTEPTPPARSAAYAFDLGGDVFSWPASRLPVRFYADHHGHMRFLVERSLRTWESQFLYGEFRGILVPDSADADVIVLWADSNNVPADVPPDTGTPVFACDGQTIFEFDSTGAALSGPVHAEVGNPFTTFTPGQVAACVQRVTLHEVGHAIGLLDHSPNTGDVMHPSALVFLPSTSDRRTIEVLYHSTPTIAPFPR